MKRFIIAAAILSTLGTSAFAMVSKEQIPFYLKQQIVQMVPNADLNNLTTTQVAAIYGLFAQGGSNGALGERPGALKVILAWD
ncbi:MAG: hypothetical protein ACK4VZ_08100 [Paracoccaceae bacterium]